MMISIQARSGAGLLNIYLYAVLRLPSALVIRFWKGPELGPQSSPVPYCIITELQGSRAKLAGATTGTPLPEVASTSR